MQYLIYIKEEAKEIVLWTHAHTGWALATEVTCADAFGELKNAGCKDLGKTQNLWVSVCEHEGKLPQTFFPTSVNTVL
jgi:hypothetical protein